MLINMLKGYCSTECRDTHAYITIIIKGWDDTHITNNNPRKLLTIVVNSIPCFHNIATPY